MYNHEPPGYDCPICQIVRGEDNAGEWTKQADVVFRGPQTTAFVNARWWGRNEGNVVVVPNRHVENIFDLPTELAGPIHETARDVALAFMETYSCEGVSTRQHNAPAGNQDAWHYHLHVFPRYAGDNLYDSSRRMSTPDERRPYADRLRPWFKSR
jgi:histidine triad (HIT) family protein